MGDRPLGEGEQYLDEVQPRPPKWRLIAAALLFCVLPVPIVIVGAKWLLFSEMSWLDYTVRSLIAYAGIAVLWFTFFRKRLS